MSVPTQQDNEPTAFEVPTWATDAAAQVASEGTVPEISAAKKALGWVAQEIPPESWFNWFWKRLSEWTLWVTRGPTRIFDGMGAMFQAHTDGKMVGAAMALVDESDNGEDAPMSVRWDEPENAAGGGFATQALAVETDGYLTAVATDNGDIVLFTRDEGTQVPEFISSAAIGGNTVRQMSSDGQILAVAAGNFIYVFRLPKFDTASGTWTAIAALWDYNHGAAVNGVYTTGQALVAVGAPGTGASTARKWNSPAILSGSNPPSTWNSAAHTPALFDVAGDGSFWWVTGTRQGGGAPGTTRRLDDATGVSLALFDHGDDTTRLCLSKEACFILGTAVGGVVIRALSRYALSTTFWNQNLPGPLSLVADICHDGDYLYAGGTNSTASVVRISAKSGDVMEACQDLTVDVGDLVTDGLRLVAGHAADGSNNVVSSLRSVTTPKWCKIYDEEGRYRFPFHNAVVPWMGQAGGST